jgi:D-3-phosphoglycerate dehydrogenase
MLKVLVADKFEQSGLDGLKALGCTVDSKPELADDSLRDALVSGSYDVLIVRSTKVNGAAIEAGRPKLIIRAGAGYNTIDVAVAKEHGIPVANCPGMNSVAVAELAFGLIIALDRFLPDNVAQLREGRWNKKAFSKARGLAGLTLGLVGFGEIAKAMVPRAQAFGMKVLVSSKYVTPEEEKAYGVTAVQGPVELARQSDIVSVHTSLRPDTKGLLGAEFFEAMKPGAFFINTSRAEVVDEAAMVESVKSGKIRAGLDVMENEPSTPEGEYSGNLKDLPGVYCTHHIGASTDQAQEAVAAETVRIVKEFGATGVAPNVVNGV